LRRGERMSCVWSMPKWTTKAFIDDALGARDIVVLTNLIRDEELPPEVRQHLSNTIHGLLTGSLKFPRRRPPKKVFIGRSRRLPKKSGGQRNTTAGKKLAPPLTMLPPNSSAHQRRYGNAGGFSIQLGMNCSRKKMNSIS
jgi:hypothetical protein